MVKRQKKSRQLLAFKIQVLCSLLGAGLSIWLLVQHTRLKSGIQDSASFCTIGSFANCDVVNASPYSEVFGIPLAAIGAIFYFLIFLFAIMASPSEKGHERVQHWIAWLCIAGLTVDFGLLLIQLVALKTVCLFCLGTYVCTFGVLACCIGMKSGKSLKERAQSALIAKSLPGLSFSTPVYALLGVSLVSYSVAVFLVPSAIWMNSRFYAFVNNAVEQFYDGWKDKPSKKIPVSGDDAFFGNKEAKVKVVAFSDFECPHCRKAAFTIHTALEPLKSRVQIVFKHFPLDKACNPGVVYQMHPKACRLARLGYCANKKGKFWAFHDKIFFDLTRSGSLPEWSGITSELGGILSQSEISSCLRQEASLKKVGTDIRLGNSIGVKSTPAIFINGKEISIPLTVETLKRLVELEAGS